MNNYHETPTTIRPKTTTTDDKNITKEGKKEND